MNELKLKELLARHSTRDIDKLEFLYRIRTEHLFQSVDECMEYLTKMATFVSINPCDPICSDSNTFKSSPVLAINVIDEAVCSLIYEIYEQIYHGDPDFLSYITHRVEELMNTILNTKYPKEYIQIQSDLYAMLMLIKFLSMPVYHKEETLCGQMSYAYYKLMYTLYNLARPKDDYFSDLAYYYEKKCKSSTK